MVRPEKIEELTARFRILGIREEDLDEQFVRSSGRGGQKVNKTSTCVILVHRPSGIRVKCRASRSQALNRFLARRRLADAFEIRERGPASAAMRAIEKIRRQKQKRRKRAAQKYAHGFSLPNTEKPV